MILETNMLGYIYTFFFILFQQSLHTTSLERSLFFMYYLLDERQLKAFISNKHVFNLQRFERERVYSGNELFNKLCTSLPSIFMTGVHPPSPHPKFPMWQKTDNGWESTRRVTTPLTLDLSNQNEKKNTINSENNDGEIKLELTKITIIATTVAMKVIMGKIQSDNNNNDSTNKQRKSWSFSKTRRQQLQNINNSLCSNKARLFILELNRFLGAMDIFHFCEDSNTLHQREFNLDGLSGMWLENWVIFGDVMDLIIIDNK